MSPTLKERLKKKEVTIGSWLTLPDPDIVEIMARCDFDWLTVDMEHSAITIAQAQQMIQVIDLVGKVPLVRVTDNDPNKIKRVMDAGAHGVIVPMVKTRAEAKRAVDAVKYPPHGKRNVGFGRAQGYGVTFEKYRQWQVGETITILQIEHIEAIENLESILSLEGVDGFIMGPYDLTGSMGIPGELDHPRMKEAWQHVKTVSAKYPVSAGFHVIPIDPKQVQDTIKEGFNFISFGLDTMFLADHCRSSLKTVRSVL